MEVSQKSLQITLCFLALAFLSSCSNKKSTLLTDQTSTTPVVIANDKTLASCNRTTDTNFTFNTMAANNFSDVKMKMSYISAAAAASGNTIQFYKWRVNGSASELDSTPLTFFTYNYSSGMTTSSALTALSTSQINPTTGLYIRLNEGSTVYQVIKVIVRDSSSNIVMQVNTLIPGFYASPEDYKINADGSGRADILQKLHPLYSTGLTDMTQITAAINQLCF